jgi:hypothetical protein
VITSPEAFNAYEAKTLSNHPIIYNCSVWRTVGNLIVKALAVIGLIGATMYFLLVQWGPRQWMIVSAWGYGALIYSFYYWLRYMR